MLPSGTRPSSSWTLSQSSGTKGSLQASGRSGCQPARVDPNTASWLMPTMRADPDALAPLQLGEGAVEVGAGDALLGEHGLSLRAAEAVQPIAPRPRLRGSSDGTRQDPHSVLGLDPVIR